MNYIKDLISQKNWDLLVSNSSPEKICEVLAFPEAMSLTKHLFYDDFQNDERQQFALQLAFKIKEHFKDEWENDWKNDVFLGDLCSMLWLYDEQFAYYKAAYDKLSDPPAALLLLLAGCHSAPDIPPISEEEAEGYLRRAVEKKLTFEAALMMRTLYRRKGDDLQAQHWDQVYKKLEAENASSDLLIPEVFKA